MSRGVVERGDSDSRTRWPAAGVADLDGGQSESEVPLSEAEVIGLLADFGSPWPALPGLVNGAGQRRHEAMELAERPVRRLCCTELCVHEIVPLSLDLDVERLDGQLERLATDHLPARAGEIEIANLKVSGQSCLDTPLVSQFQALPQVRARHLESGYTWPRILRIGAHWAEVGRAHLLAHRLNLEKELLQQLCHVAGRGPKPTQPCTSLPVDRRRRWSTRP